MNFLELRASRLAVSSLVAMLGIAAHAITLASCQPITFGESDDIVVRLDLDSGETAKAGHLTWRIESAVAISRLDVTEDFYVEVCRDDGLPLGTGLGVVRVVGDAPSTTLTTIALEGSGSCVQGYASITDWPTGVDAGVPLDCGFTLEVERSASSSETPLLHVSANTRASARGDGETPSGFRTELREDD